MAGFHEMTPGLSKRIHTYSKWAAISITLLFAAYFLITDDDLLGRGASYFFPPPQEGVTELYFTNYEALPKRLNVGKQYIVEFEIANHEGRKEVYTYQATIAEDQSVRDLPPQQVELEDGQSAKLRVIFTPSVLYTRDEVDIRLLDRDQSIQFSASS